SISLLRIVVDEPSPGKGRSTQGNKMRETPHPPRSLCYLPPRKFPNQESAIVEKLTHCTPSLWRSGRSFRYGWGAGSKNEWKARWSGLFKGSTARGPDARAKASKRRNEVVSRGESKRGTRTEPARSFSGSGTKAGSPAR